MTTRDEFTVDEASRESFPASDAPSWTPTHAGTPRTGARLETPRELREGLRAHVAACAKSGGELSDHVADALLLAGRSITRIPLTRGSTAENIEAVIHGSALGPEVVVGARYRAAGGAVDDPSAIAVLLGLARLLEGRRFARSVRLVAFADDAKTTGSRAYARRIRSQRIGVRGAILLHRVAFLRSGPLFVVADPEAVDLVHHARRSLAAGHVDARSLVLPRALELLWSSDREPFARHGYPAITLTDPWPALRRARVLDHEMGYDAMSDLAFAVAGLVARLAGST